MQFAVALSLAATLVVNPGSPNLQPVGSASAAIGGGLNRSLPGTQAMATETITLETPGVQRVYAPPSCDTCPHV